MKALVWIAMVTGLMLTAVILEDPVSVSHADEWVGENEDIPWTITYPGNGDLVYGTAPFIGGGDADELGTLAVFEYHNVNPNGTYPSELDLRLAVNVSTQSSSTWTWTTICPYGTWYACVYESSQGNGLLNPFPVGDPSEPETDVSTLLTLMEGNGVMFTSEENVN